jgi:hypothetical protein
MADIDYQDYETAKQYYGKAKSCIDEGSSSDACKQLAKEGGEKALIAAGVDPQLAHEAMQCAESRDSEMCAKASAKLAAVYACTSATGGSGYTLCNELAPKVVDKIWPVAGPPLVMAWDTAFAVLDGVAGALQGIASALGNILGFGSDGPTITELQNELMWRGQEIVSASIESGVKATSAADIQSRIELGLPLELPTGSFGLPDITVRPEVNATLIKTQSESKNIFSKKLRQQPGFKALAVEARTRIGSLDKTPIEFKFVDPSKQPGAGKVMLVAGEVPPGWHVDDTGWSPSGFEIRRSSNSAWHFDDMRDAYGMVLAARAEAISNAASESVGEMVALNVKAANAPSSEKDEGIGWLWWAAIIGGGVLAYVNRAKIARAAKRLTR